MLYAIYPPLSRFARVKESTLSVFTFDSAIALVFSGFDKVTLCLSDNILYAQYHVEELSITMSDPNGIES